jgi:signal peptidase I
VPAGTIYGLFWLATGRSVANSLFSAVFFGAVMGTFATFQAWRQWPGARDLEGSNRVRVARAVRLGSQIDDPHLAPAVLDYAGMTRRTQKRGCRFMWFVWLIAALTLALAIGDTLNRPVSKAVVWWALVAFWIGFFAWLPRKRARVLANASQAEAAARELSPDAGEKRPAAATPAPAPGPPLPRWLVSAVMLALVICFLASFGKTLLMFALLVAIPVGVRWKRTPSRERAALIVIWAASILFVARLLIPGIVVRTVAINSAAMQPTIAQHDRVMFNRLGGFGVGDIVAFHAPKDAHRRLCGPSPHMIAPGGGACAAPEYEQKRGFYIRRFVAGPGDVISIVAGEVVRNGVPERAAYATPCHERQFPECCSGAPVVARSHVSGVA